MKRLIIYAIVLSINFLLQQPLYAVDKVVNVFAWSDEIPAFIMEKFTRETGIKVNYSTYESNEVMFAKLQANKVKTYDIVEPSSYYVDRLRHLNMIEKLEKSKLPNAKNLDPEFLNQAYDPHSVYSMPFIWGITGIFVNTNYFPRNDLHYWSNLLHPKFFAQLMLLDDAREVFSMALRMLGYSINDTDPKHIHQAFLKLKKLMPNVRLFNSDAVASILIDEDATAGMAWNGDLFKAATENPKLHFVYPQDGFEIWVDNLVILKGAPHRDNAYKFFDFLMRPEIAKEITLHIKYATANLAARALLPADIKNSPILYPPHAILSHGEFETDVGCTISNLYEGYWEQLKMGA